MKINHMSTIVMLIGALAIPASVLAQGQGRDKGDRIERGKRRDNGKERRAGKKGPSGMKLRGTVRRELGSYLYPVGLVRHYSFDLKLTDDQINKLRKVVTDVNNELEQLKWDIERETQKLVDTVKNHSTKDQVYNQMDSVFKYENKMKKKHLGLMIVIRDILTKEQRKFLDDIKAKQGFDHGRPFGGPGSGPHEPPFRRGGPKPPDRPGARF